MTGDGRDTPMVAGPVKGKPGEMTLVILPAGELVLTPEQFRDLLGGSR